MKEMTWPQLAEQSLLALERLLQSTHEGMITDVDAVYRGACDLDELASAMLHLRQQGGKKT